VRPSPVYNAIAALSWPLLHGLFRLRASGREHLPADGGYVLACNHVSSFDPWPLGLPLWPRRFLRFMAKSELFRLRPLAAVLRSLNAFPVERGGGDRTAMSEAARLLERGELLGIFPQGTSKPERQVGWHRGAARLALATGAPLVPVRMTGTRALPLRTRVRIVVGEPIAVAAARPTVAGARALTERLVQAVTAA